MNKFENDFNTGADWARNAPKAITVPFGLLLWASLGYATVSIGKKLLNK